VTKRNALSPRLRFEVFKRDGFRCIYCGATPVESVLHVDHVKPIAEGGDDEPTNLVTACQACNGGKSCVPLGEKRLGPMRTPEEAKDHAEQILAYLEAEKAVLDAKRAFTDEVASEWEKATGWGLTACEKSFLITSTEKYGLSNVVEAIQIAASRIFPSSDSKRDQCFRYLCGIVRRWRETGICTPHFPASMVEEPKSEEPADKIEMIRSAIRLLQEWIGMKEPYCEVCLETASDHPKIGVGIVTIAPLFRDTKPTANNIIFMCSQCLDQNKELLLEAERLISDGSETNPRETYMRLIWTDRGRIIGRVEAKCHRIEEGGAS